jgi:hypothetical protein
VLEGLAAIAHDGDGAMSMRPPYRGAVLVVTVLFNTERPAQRLGSLVARNALRAAKGTSATPIISRRLPEEV